MRTRVVVIIKEGDGKMNTGKKVVLWSAPRSGYGEEETARSVYLMKKRARQSLAKGIPWAWYDEHEIAGSVARMKAAHRRRHGLR